MALVLRGGVGHLVCLIAVVCSTWSAMNKHTSKRDWLVPFGDTSLTCVRQGNKQVSRTVSNTLLWRNVFFRLQRLTVSQFMWFVESLQDGFSHPAPGSASQHLRA